MTQANINTKAYLEYLRDRRAKIDALIKAIVEFDDDGSESDTRDSNSSPSAFAPGIYADMTIAGAAMHFLKSAGKPQGTIGIVQALKRGGTKTASKNLYRTVYNSLNTKVDKGLITKARGKWGLAEWQQQQENPR